MYKISFDISSKLKIRDTQSRKTGDIFPALYGQLSETEKTSPNGYRYKSGFWDNVLKDSNFQDRLTNREVVGMIEHPDNDEHYFKTPYERVAIVVDSVELINGAPWGTILLPNTPDGNILKALAELNVPLGISTRGLGNKQMDSIGEYVSDEGFSLIGWDITRNPNFDVSMSRVSDSIMQSSNFKNICQLYGIRDSKQGDGLPPNEYKDLINTIEKTFNQLKDLINKK